MRYEVKMSKLLGNFLLLFFLLVVGGCSPYVADLKPEDYADLPDTYSAEGVSTVQPDRWWQGFNSSDLDRLIDEALNDNLSLRQAWARLQQAQALSRQAESSQKPDLDFSSYYSGSRTRDSGDTDDSEEFSLGLSSSFELDLWGRVAAEVKSQSKEEAATREDLNTAAISLAAEVTENWLSLIAQIEQQRLLNEQIETAQNYLDLIDLRYRKSQATALELLQQQESIAALKTQLPSYEQEEQLLRMELAVLLGNNPQEKLNLTQTELPELQPLPQLGLPIELLEQRPDIRAAALRLEAADLDLVVAKANRLPALKLTASATTSGDFNELFDDWILNLLANLTAPLLDGGNLKAEVEQQKAVIYEELASYQETVLTAIQDVENALMSEQKLQDELAAQKQQLALAERALAAAQKRYLKGNSTYLSVLTEQQSVEQLQQDILTQQLDLLTNRVALHRALGGDWTSQLPEQQYEVQL
jgi:NodT family efflux transporter outer membrane factor (OMF) lipoprotein